MIDRIIAFSLKNRFLVLAFYLGIAGWGYWALAQSPVDAIPDLSDNQVIVFTDWTGRSPQEVEDQVTYPAHGEPSRGLPGVRVVRSQFRLWLLDDLNRNLRGQRGSLCFCAHARAGAAEPRQQRRCPPARCAHARTGWRPASGTSSGTPSKSRSTFDPSVSSARSRTGSSAISSMPCLASPEVASVGGHEVQQYPD